MNHAVLRVLLLAAALLAQPGFHADAQAPRTKPGTNHVVIVSLDGFPASALDDARLPLPNLRRLAARGAVAKGMRPVNPSVTWPNHTTMVTGVRPAKHGVLFNGVLVREPGMPARTEWRDKKEMVRVPTLYDLAHQRGLTTAQVDWVAIQNAPTITWEFRERPQPTDAIPLELVKAGVLSQPDLETFASGNILWRDYVWTQAGARILRVHRPNLLLFHLLNLDSTHHRYGPRTPAALNTMAYLDTQVGALLDALRESGMAPRTTVFVVSDHGFKQVKRQIRPNAAFMKAGLLQATDGKVTQAQAWTVPEGGSAMVYVTVPDPSGQVLARARKALEGIEGVDRMIEPKEYAPLGLPLPAANEQMGVLYLTAREGYAFTAATGDDLVVDAPAGSLGAHGYVATDPDMLSLFIAWGRGIRPGAKLDVIDNVDLAPTAARLLGIELQDADGRPLEAILAAARK